VQKPTISTLEMVFVLIATSILFILIFYEMSTSGILPGNDPAVHLGKSATIVINQRVSYSAVPWYPPLFHTIVATLQIFAGTLDVFVSAFILKLLISTLYVLMLLSSYLICRKLFGIGVAVVSVVFIILSLPLIEMIFWGGYANFLGLAYIAFIFYIINKELHDIKKMFLLFLAAFTIVMSHQLATFVFVLMFVPIFIINSLSGSKRKTLVYLSVIVGAGLAIFAWYAQMFIEYSNMIVEHLFFAMAENIYNIPEVGLDALIRNNFGTTLILGFAAIPITIIWLKKKQNIKAIILLFAWLVIPFILSQSYLFGLYLPYIRFVYFLATPIAIFTAILTYSLTKTPKILEKIVQKIKNKKTIIIATKFLTLVIVAALFVLQASYFIERTESFPDFYERATIQSYYAGAWIKEHSPSEGIVVSSRSPGSWLNIFSDRHTLEETNPLYSRNPIAESVVYSFYEAENDRTLLREYKQSNPKAGQEIYTQVYNIWKTGISLPNDQTNLIYVDINGRWVIIPLNTTEIAVYWKIQTENEAQLVTEYKHELFNVTKVATLFSNSSIINVKWLVQTYKTLANVKLTLTHNMNPIFNYQEALAPGILYWQNTWDNVTYAKEDEHWAVIETSFDNLQGKTIAYFAPENQILAVVEFNDPADWLTFGVLENRFMDILRVRYELGYINMGQTQEISYSILLCSSDFSDLKQYDASELMQHYEQTTDTAIQERDFPSYIEEYDIKFVVIDTEKLSEQLFQIAVPSPDLDRIYDTGRILTYITKR